MSKTRSWHLRRAAGQSSGARRQPSASACPHCTSSFHSLPWASNRTIVPHMGTVSSYLIKWYLSAAFLHYLQRWNSTQHSNPALLTLWCLVSHLEFLNLFPHLWNRNWYLPRVIWQFWENFESIISWTFWWYHVTPNVVTSQMPGKSATWASHVTTVCLSFLISNMGMMVTEPVS